MLSTEQITLHYGASQILYGIDVAAEVGQVVCLMGTNGVGKTSFLNALSGHHPCSGGRYFLDGNAVSQLSAHALAAAGVAYVPQGRMIFPLLTVKENLETGFACLKKSDRFIPDQIYELFPVLKEMNHRRGGDLSGGQQQQLAIARALITQPKLLLLDEPTEGIQPNIIKQIGSVIGFLRDQKEMAIVLVEQYFDFAYDLADHFYAMRRGEIILAGEKSAIDKEALRQAVSV